MYIWRLGSICRINCSNWIPHTNVLFLFISYQSNGIHSPLAFVWNIEEMGICTQEPECCICISIDHKYNLLFFVVEAFMEWMRPLNDTHYTGRTVAHKLWIKLYLFTKNIIYFNVIIWPLMLHPEVQNHWLPYE